MALELLLKILLTYIVIVETKKFFILVNVFSSEIARSFKIKALEKFVSLKLEQ